MMNSREPPRFDDIDAEAYQKIEAIIGKDGIQQAFAPIDQISGLPNSAYHSSAWFDLEMDRVFRRNWVFATTDGELSRPGTIKPLEVGGTPILMVRDREGTVRGFHNTCRHRGTELVSEVCRQPLLTCPYHAWTYRLDGTILSRPHFHRADETETFSPDGDSRFNLYPVRTASWNGCHFVDLSGHSPPLLDWLAPMLRRTSVYDLTLIRWIGKKSYTIQGNWKFVLENYMEGYHVFCAHPRLLDHAPMSVRWQGEWTEHVFYNDYVASSITTGRGEGLPHYPNLSDENRRRGAWFTVFPNFAAEVYADQFVVLATFPMAPDRTCEELHFFVVGDEAQNRDEFSGARNHLKDMWNKLNLEDVDLLERLQRGRRSKAFTGSWMSPAWEGPSHQFSQKIVEAICRK